jgi:hypothetical protein
MPAPTNPDPAAAPAAPAPGEREEGWASRWWRPPHLRAFGVGERHATWLELFFDLCFVAAVAAPAADLHHDPTPAGVVRVAGLFVPVWWAWMGFTWYATAFDTDDVLFRLALLAVLDLGTQRGEERGGAPLVGRVDEAARLVGQARERGGERLRPGDRPQA